MIRFIKDWVGLFILLILVSLLALEIWIKETWKNLRAEKAKVDFVFSCINYLGNDCKRARSTKLWWL